MRLRLVPVTLLFVPLMARLFVLVSSAQTPEDNPSSVIESPPLTLDTGPALEQTNVEKTGS